MLERQPRKTYLGLKLIIAGECIGFVGTFLFFQYMRSSESSRYYMHKHFPLLLDGFYSLEDMMFKENSKLSDIALWQRQQNEN